MHNCICMHELTRLTRSRARAAAPGRSRLRSRSDRRPAAHATCPRGAVRRSAGGGHRAETTESREWVGLALGTRDSAAAVPAAPRRVRASVRRPELRAIRSIQAGTSQSIPIPSNRLPSAGTRAAELSPLQNCEPERASRTRSTLTPRPPGQTRIRKDLLDCRR